MKHSLELIIDLYKRRNFELLSLFDKQEMAMEVLTDDITTELTYGGAGRGGKSRVLCVWKIMNRFSLSGSKGLIAREEMTKLKDTTQKTYWEVMDFLGGREGEDFIWHAGKQEVEFFNGSREMFRELKHFEKKDPEYDRIGSYDLTDAAIDEAQQIHWKAREVLKGRYSELTGENKVMKNGIITKEPWVVIPKALYTCNPAKNWIHSDFYQKDKNGTLEEHKSFIPALPSDNPYVPQSYIDNLKTADKVTRERLLYGNFDFDDDPDSLCEWEAICDIFNNTHVIPDVDDKYLVADIAMHGRDKFILSAWEGLVGTIALEEEKSSGKSIENAIVSEKEKRGVPNRNIIADSDGLGSYLESYIDNIDEFHGGARPTDNTYGNLKSQCAFKLAELINDSKIRLICTKEQEEEIKLQISTCLKRSPNVDDEKHRIIKKSKMKEKLGYSPDYLDVLIMRMKALLIEDYDVFI